MADQKMDLEPLERLEVEDALCRKHSRASITAQSFTGSKSSMRKSFKSIQDSVQFRADTEAQINKYDTNKDGMFDRSEVERIVMDVKFEAHAAKETAAGAKLIAEGLNDTKVR